LQCNFIDWVPPIVVGMGETLFPDKKIVKGDIEPNTRGTKKTKLADWLGN
jgi:hypothetical protein